MINYEEKLLRFKAKSDTLRMISESYVPHLKETYLPVVDLIDDILILKESIANKKIDIDTMCKLQENSLHIKNVYVKNRLKESLDLLELGWHDSACRKMQECTLMGFEIIELVDYREIIVG